MITVIHLRGTSEPLTPHGISTTFLSALDSRFHVVTPSYPADYGMPVPFEESNRLGREAAIREAQLAPGAVVLTGYSAGGLISGDLARDIAAGQVPTVPPAKLIAVALLADPKRPVGGGAPGLPTQGGYGILGQRPIPRVRAYYGCAFGDPISALGADNPIRSIADLSRRFTTNPRGLDGWVRDMFEVALSNQLQPWWRHPFRPQRWGAAVDALAAYLVRGQHTDSYLREGICEGLAQVLNEEIR